MFTFAIPFYQEGQTRFAPISTLGRSNIEFSCPAATDHQRWEFKTACTAPRGLLGDNCNDLLHGAVRI